MALDASDDPWSMELKQAWMNRPAQAVQGLAACLDPYEAVTTYLKDTLAELHIEPSGRFAVPTWLHPRPEASDMDKITIQNFAVFYDSGDLPAMLEDLRGYVANEVLPAFPIMVGVDHAATKGVLSALADKYGPENLSVIVLDQHFDAIPLTVRVKETSGTIENPMSGMPMAVPEIPDNFQEYCCCGNFWAYLPDEGQIRPQELHRR